jgi:hypothetical protein
MMFICLLISSAVIAQDLFKGLTEKYASLEGFSATNLTRDMFDLYLKKKQLEPNSPVFETIKKLDNILVVTYNGVPSGKDSVAAGTIAEIEKSLLSYYNGKSFTLFKTENRHSEDLKVFLKKNGDKVIALSLVSATPSRLTLIELNGAIDLASVSEIDKALNIRGLENLYKINGQQDVFVTAQDYPFGIYNKYGETYDLQSKLGQSLENLNKLNAEKMENFNKLNAEKMKAWADQNKEMTREQRKLMAEKQKEMAEQQKEMAEKYRQMAEKYGRHPIFLSAPGDTNMIYYIDGKKVSVNEINRISSDKIESISVVKPDKNHPNKKGEMRIKTRK